MIQKSSASLQGALFSELKELLALIGDSKKAKEQVELLAEDVATIKELYQKNQSELEKQVNILAEIKKEKDELIFAKSELKEEKELFEKKKNALLEKEMAVSLLEKKVNQYKNEIDSELSVKTSELENLKLSFTKAKLEADEKSKNADSLIKEYEEKLSKLKAMVG